MLSFGRARSSSISKKTNPLVQLSNSRLTVHVPSSSATRDGGPFKRRRVDGPAQQKGTEEGKGGMEEEKGGMEEERKEGLKEERKALRDKKKRKLSHDETSQIRSTDEKRVSDLQSKLFKRLTGGRFRYLNEQLYTKAGATMFQEMQESPELFDEYHRGYREQVHSWKRNPTDLIIEWLRRKVPKSATIADLGCGEAHIAKALPSYRVLSYDLVSLAPDLVIAANIANLPLENEGVDVCIFCLSLMGTDWPSFIIEAFRVLKPGGKLKIAEVQSRFPDIQNFIDAIKSVGFRLTSKTDLDSYFYLFEFSKAKLNSKDKSKLTPDLLTPCRYKKR